LSADSHVVVIGGGPAGLSAALILGRCRRRVVVIDDANPRNAAAQGVHGFLGSDGVPPAELRRRGRVSLEPYDVSVLDDTAVDARAAEGGFCVTTKAGKVLSTRKLLLATGIKDQVPRIPGIAPLYGFSIFQCAYCDGWEVRDRPLAAYGGGNSCAEFALGLTTWSGDVILFTDGHPKPTDEMAARLARHSVGIRQEKIVDLIGEGKSLRYVVLANGERIARAAMFIHLGQQQRSDLAERLGCSVEEDEQVDTRDRQATCVPGVYVAGDAARDVKFAIVAAAQGARAAHAINQALREEDTR
jgi:thioredoxin reductase